MCTHKILRLCCIVVIYECKHCFAKRLHLAREGNLWHQLWENQALTRLKSSIFTSKYVKIKSLRKKIQEINYKPIQNVGNVSAGLLLKVLRDLNSFTNNTQGLLEANFHHPSDKKVPLKFRQLSNSRKWSTTDHQLCCQHQQRSDGGVSKKSRKRTERRLPILQDDMSGGAFFTLLLPKVETKNTDHYLLAIFFYLIEEIIYWRLLW